MQICNACRYCEGYCAVFPAMERRHLFSDADCDYLANLCHNCRGCYYACQYAAPHEFDLNIPKAMAELRVQSYEKYAWPAPLARLFQRNGLVVSLGMALGVMLVLMSALLLQSNAVLFGRHTEAGAFYQVIPYEVMTSLASGVMMFVLLALGVGFYRFWNASGNSLELELNTGSLRQAISDVLTLRYLGGGGSGCNDTSDAFSMTRRALHHATFYGFMLCFAATCVATIYDHIFGWIAPYDYFSLPVVLGTLGGISLCGGTAGLFWLKVKEDQQPAARRLLGMDVAFIALLFLTSLTGLALLALRETPAMGVLLAIHLGLVLTLFLLLPYSKFVHAIYRFAALLRYAAERWDKLSELTAGDVDS
jgi:citrate/tricarballylate utilization protein